MRKLNKAVATSVFTDADGAINVKYHNTVVFKLSADRSTVTLNTGGWKTATTKKRINQAFAHYGVALSVYQKSSARKYAQWFVLNQRTGEATEFADNGSFVATGDNLGHRVYNIASGTVEAN